jgi:regulator of protease activity HflC (stomatin/prohibitin superfamily)
MFTPKKIVLAVVAAILTIVLITSLGKIWEDVDAGEVVVIQDPIDGELHVYITPGWEWQGLGKATHYRKSNQFWFNAPKTKDDVDLSIPVKWNDGGHSEISGSVRYDLPTDNKQLIVLHSIFGSQTAIENQLIKTNIEKAVYMVGPLMTSKESYAEKRNDLIFYIEDQASRGVYKTKQTEVKTTDDLTGNEKTVTRVEVIESVPGQPVRQEKSPIAGYGIRLYNISINGIKYDKTVEQQIQTQQQAIMQVQTAIANAKKAEQDAITIAKQGEAGAAKAKWDQEIIKAKMVTEAESRKRVAELDVQTAGLTKQKETLEGEGIAAKKRLIMNADGALTQKLETYKETQKYWAEAFAAYQGNVVPLYQTGATTGGNGGFNFMEIMGAKAARDLNLDMKNK